MIMLIFCAEVSWVFKISSRLAIVPTNPLLSRDLPTPDYLSSDGLAQCVPESPLLVAKGSPIRHTMIRLHAMDMVLD